VKKKKKIEDSNFIILNIMDEFLKNKNISYDDGDELDKEDEEENEEIENEIKNLENELKLLELSSIEEDVGMNESIYNLAEINDDEVYNLEEDNGMGDLKDDVKDDEIEFDDNNINDIMSEFMSKKNLNYDDD
jgi:hypothetical protein